MKEILKNNLRTIRDGKKLTLKQLADLTGGKYAFQTVSAYEKLDKRLPSDFLQVMAEVLKTSAEAIQNEPQKLMEDSPEYKVVMVNPRAFSDEHLQQLYDRQNEELRTCEPERKKLLLESIRALALELERRLP